MKRLQLLFLCHVCSIVTVTSSITADRYSCVTAYWDTITCFLNSSSDLVGRPNTTYSLEFKELFQDPTSCPLVLMDDGYGCDCRVPLETDYFSTSEEYKIELCSETSCHVLFESFEPSENIQLTPPHDLEVKLTPQSVNITWKSGYEDHRFLFSILDFQLLLQTSQSTEARPLHVSSKTSESVKRSDLSGGTTYCIKVRSRPYESKNDYRATWSEWSPSACLKNEEGEEQAYILVILMTSLGPACVAVGVLLFVFNNPAARMKIKTLSHTPSPAPFFSPLYQQHNGNLQDWLSPKDKVLLTYTPEEILMTDAVVVEPKPIQKEPEENMDLQKPFLLPALLLTQSQLSYIGLPEIHKASPPVQVCPGDTPNTKLSGSVWGVKVRELEVVSTPVREFLNKSRADSGCSCEEESTNLELSPPVSPVEESPLPCLCSDYCILNKTSYGFTPVLVSKGGSMTVHLDSLQEKDRLSIKV